MRATGMNPAARSRRTSPTSLLVDREVVRGHTEDQHRDGGLVGGAVSGLAAGVVPLAGRALVAGSQQLVAHPLVVLLPQLAADLVHRVAGVVVAVPVVTAVVGGLLHELH